MNKKSKTFSFFKNLKFMGEFFKAKSVSIFEKFKIIVFTILSIIYFFIPIDIIPDIFFGIGWIEDAGIIIALLIYINERIGKYNDSKHSGSDDWRKNIIDVDFKEVKSNEKK